MKELRAGDLGIANCDYIARGEDSRALVKDLISHLRKEHNLKMPSPDVILDPRKDRPSLLGRLVATFTGGRSRGTQIIVGRLRTALDIKTDQESPSQR
jgi:predicted small metal-binding protein